ncbi:uncharacterized protein CCDC197 [Eublepharis macularius]|uniref:Uncharacterized protein CCDC197 n=1 Tax=Eublepharis macularius TaxID=481883 RepID=A0AA97IY95_EUBMA|nr:uncharacterized protein CCDC197 [Eublepharis macularius]XP_054827835.1 uncharacterized protein CCDC197 [Eublepharis macularius]
MEKDSDPKYVLQVENRRKNIFVTQLGEHREEEDEDVSRIPIIHEDPRKILQHHGKTLQRTLLLQKEVEHDQVTAELIAKRQEFQKQMEKLAQRSAEFSLKEEAGRARALKFDRYLKDCEQKKERAMKKYQNEQKLNQIKKSEIHKLKEELKELRVRQQKLQRKVAKCKVYEDFLRKLIEALPANYLECGEESLIRALIKRHETLMTANQNLTENLSSLLHNLERSRQEFGTLQEEHDTAKVMLISKLSELQTKCSTLQGKNTQLEMYISHKKGHFRNQREELGKMLLAISDLAEQCCMWHYGPLKEMPLLSKLDMIQEFILEKQTIREQTVQSDELETSSCSLKERPYKSKKL